MHLLLVEMEMVTEKMSFIPQRETANTIWLQFHHQCCMDLSFHTLMVEFYLAEATKIRTVISIIPSMTAGQFIQPPLLHMTYNLGRFTTTKSTFPTMKTLKFLILPQTPGQAGRHLKIQVERVLVLLHGRNSSF